MFRTANRTAIRSGVLRRAAASTALTGALLLPHLAQAQTVPTGGVPVSGSVTIGTPTGNANGGLDLGVSQTEARGIVNWQSFSLGRNDKITFDQPTGGATLNRVTGGTSSTIAGQIVANGSVYLINPNGIAITSTGSVQTGGGFIASTLDITNDNFNAGANSFTGGGASANVTNAGSIAASGFAALLGGSVSNAGTISVPAGRVALGSGEAITLDVNGANFLAVSIPTAATTANGVALIESAGTITGGRIELSAATAADAVRRVVNVTGTINADNANGDGGSIVLSAVGPAGSLGGGTVSASGTLTAQATGTGNNGGNGGQFGNGGTITLSGGTLSLTGLTASTRTWSRDNGTLTLRQAGTFTAATGNDSLGNLLGNNNVTIITTSGDIVLADPLFWMMNTALTLNSARDITLNQIFSLNFSPPFFQPNGALNLSAGGGVANAGTITSTGDIFIGLFNLTNGNWVQNTATLPAFRATDFRFDRTRATFLRAAGGNGSVGTPYRITDVYGLQGMASSNQLAGNFVLANDIDAGDTANWNGGGGFFGIGTDAARFTGSLSGANGSGGRYVIAGLTQNRTGIGGLFGSLSGTVSNLSLTGVAITATGNRAGGLATVLNAGGRISNVSVAGSVSGDSVLGGLVGSAISATLTDVRSDVVVNGTRNLVGGLVGQMAGGSITRGIATGSVKGGNVFDGINDNGSTGGLVGLLNGGGIVTDSAASGAVTGAGFYVGGLIGDMVGGASVNRSSATGDVTNSRTNTGGLVGRLANNGTGTTGITSSITNSFATGIVTGGTNVGGLVGLQSASSGGSTTISGTYASGAVKASGQSVGGLIGLVSVTGGVNGTAASVAYSYATGAVSTTANSATTYVGGLIGQASRSNNAGTTLSISNAYATGAVSSGGNAVGGLIGLANRSMVNNVYAIGSVSGIDNIGGLIGTVGADSVISNAYASGAVTAQRTNAGGLVGAVSTGNQLTNTYWDSYSTGKGNALGSTSGGGIAVTSSPNRATTDRSAYAPGSYSFGASSVGTATPSGFVFLAGNSTRPFLAFEVPTAARFGAVPTDPASVRTIVNGHELQLIGYNAETLSGRYRQGANIDLSATGANMATTANANDAGIAATAAGMWAPTGFVSLGTDGAGNVWNGTGFVPLAANAAAYGFGGTFDGEGRFLAGLTINRATANYTGLFGLTNGTLSNVLVEGSVTGLGSTGGLVGFLYQNGMVTGSTSGVLVTGNAVNTGGLVGSAATGSTVALSRALQGVRGTSNVGGLIGYASGARIDQSFVFRAGPKDPGAVGTSYVGGLIGYAYLSTITDSFAYASASATNTGAGGLIGKIVGGSVARTYSFGAATAPRGAGGLIGQADASARVTNSYWNTESSGQTTSAGGTGKTGAELAQQSTYVGWDFVNVWTPPSMFPTPLLRRNPLFASSPAP